MLRPVDPDVAVAAARTSLDISGAISEVTWEEHKLNAVAIARKLAQGQASSSWPRSQPTLEAHQPQKEMKPPRAHITKEYTDKPLSNKYARA